MVSNVESNLHIYVKYAEEDSMRVFSINNADECSVSDAIPMNGKGDQWVRSTPLGNVQLYSLQYQYQSRFGSARRQKVDPSEQNFSAYTSVDLKAKVSLQQPPVVFGDADLCTVQNNISTYNKTVSKTFTKTSNTGSFSDDELGRGVYNYNCEVDSWNSVPPMKTQVRDSSMVVCCDSLYLIGGSEVDGSAGAGTNRRFAQAYDYREKSWRAIPPSNNEHVGADSTELNGEVYVTGGTSQGSGNTAERFDPKAGKWEEIASMSMDMRYHRLSSYSDALWSTGGFSAAGKANTNLSMQVYEPSRNQWASSSVLMRAAQRSNYGRPTAIVDSVVFKALH